MSKRILILGDSLTLGRRKDHTEYKDTWPRLLEDHGHRVFNRGVGGGDSYSVLSEAKHLDWHIGNEAANKVPFDLCFIQVGIVDCTPRLLPKKINQIAKSLPIIHKLIMRMSRSQLLIQHFGKPWVQIDKFEKNISEITEVTSRLANKTFFIEISRPAHFLVKNCGDFSANVDQYNTILSREQRATLLRVYDSIKSDEGILPDGHHLTKTGHQNIAYKIVDIISKKADA